MTATRLHARWRRNILLGDAVTHDRLFLVGPHSRRRELWLVLRTCTGLHQGIPDTALCRAMCHSVWLRPLRHVTPAIRARSRSRVANRGIGFHGDDRRRPRPDGSGEPRRQGSGWTVSRLQYRTAARTAAEPVPRSLGHLSALLRPQGAAVQVLVCLCRAARRDWDTRRAVRGADADSNRQDRPFPDRADGNRVLAPVQALLRTWRTRVRSPSPIWICSWSPIRSTRPWPTCAERHRALRPAPGRPTPSVLLGERRRLLSRRAA